MDDIDIQNIEIQLLLQAIYLKYGYDFRNYAKASLKRRIEHRLLKDKLSSISAMQHRLLYDEDFFSNLLLDLSINVTEMFRDPDFYQAIRKNVIPHLQKFPFLKIWHAGCSTGEEVYSMAILLKEEGLYERTQIYATDMNEVVLRQAKQGIFSMSRLKQYTANYQKAGGTESFSDYYAAHYDHVVMDKSLKENILFSDHNLATDGVFGEMNLIMCRNVMIYFDRDLQNRVFRLFHESLCAGGVLCLGSKETIRLSAYTNAFDDIVKEEKIYLKNNL
ncbi:CheR family methyltransferase [Beggiatoa leptomitoformis]|uniref:Protein-glutamate O-methyltransferase CheR n=1 Tax=Beggiatoa leptomitoformis TaxID=288004 RepID=A0A2N9YBG7_9GAMM|nr:protein-glutamate O-methyltransferase CheR [Beggiatoa leptomitoformis]ALG66843.1 protein-glutamate O-methyltransferase CheR [Beggiatoa leptomitoformis]AUI67806.1 protein-glutamate O-methyltransferase CheR [Beggiatoa leptomitoformis]